MQNRDSYSYYYEPTPSSTSTNDGSTSGPTSESSNSSNSLSSSHSSGSTFNSQKSADYDEQQGSCSAAQSGSFAFRILHLNVSMIYPVIMICLFVLSIIAVEARHQYPQNTVVTNRGERASNFLLAIGGSVNVIVIVTTGLRMYYEYRQMQQGVVSKSQSNSYGVLFIITVAMFIPFLINMWYLFVWEEDVGYKAEMFFAVTRSLVTLIPIIAEFQYLASHKSKISREYEIIDLGELFESAIVVSPFAGVVSLFLTLLGINTHIAKEDLIDEHSRLFWTSLIIWFAICLTIILTSWGRITRAQQLIFVNTFCTTLYSYGVFLALTSYVGSYILANTTPYAWIGSLVIITSVPIYMSLHIIAGKMDVVESRVIHVEVEFGVPLDDFNRDVQACAYDMMINRSYNKSTLTEKFNRIKKENTGISNSEAKSRAFSSTYDDFRGGWGRNKANRERFDSYKNLAKSKIRSKIRREHKVRHGEVNDLPIMRQITKVGVIFGGWTFCLAALISGASKDNNYVLVFVVSSLVWLGYLAQIMKLCRAVISTYELEEYTLYSSALNLSQLMGIPIISMIYFELVVGYSNFPFIYTIGSIVMLISVLGLCIYLAYPIWDETWIYLERIARSSTDSGDNIIRIVGVLIFVATLNTVLAIGDTYGIERGYMTDTQSRRDVERGIQFWNVMTLLKSAFICGGYILLSQRIRSSHMFWYTKESYTKSVAMIVSYLVLFYLFVPVILGIYLDTVTNVPICNSSVGFNFECTDPIGYSYYAISFMMYVVLANPTPFLV